MNTEKYVIEYKIYDIINRFVPRDNRLLYVTKNKSITNDFFNNDIIKFNSYKEAKEFNLKNYQEIKKAICSFFSIKDFYLFIKEDIIHTETIAKQEFISSKLSNFSVQQLVDIYNMVCIKTNKLKYVIVNIENATDNSVLENVSLTDNHKYVVLDSAYDILVPYTDIQIAFYIMASDLIANYAVCHNDFCKQYFK